MPPTPNAISPVVQFKGPWRMGNHRLSLVTLPDAFAVGRLPAGAPVPAWATGEFVSITRTADELSVVCREGAVPEGVRRETGWRCLRVAGTLGLSLVGVLASLALPLA